MTARMGTARTLLREWGCLAVSGLGMPGGDVELSILSDPMDESIVMHTSSSGHTSLVIATRQPINPSFEKLT